MALPAAAQHKCAIREIPGSCKFCMVAVQRFDRNVRGSNFLANTQLSDWLFKRGHSTLKVVTFGGFHENHGYFRVYTGCGR